MPEELNELQNQSSDQLGEESGDQLNQESGAELTFDEVLKELPEDRRKIVEEGYLRNKDYTQGKQRLSQKEKQLEAERASNQRKTQFYDRFIEDPQFRREVLNSLGEKQIPQKTDNFDERYSKAQEIINNLDGDSRTAINYLVEKGIREKIAPINEKLSAFEAQQQERWQRKIQQANQERQEVFRNFAKEYPDYVDVEPEMNDIIGGFPGFYNQPPKQLGKMLKKIYQMVNLPKVEQKAKEKGIKQMLDQSIKAQTSAQKSVSKPSPRKTFTNNKQKMSIDECYEKVWGEQIGE